MELEEKTYQGYYEMGENIFFCFCGQMYRT